MKERSNVSKRRKYDSSFKEDVLQMIRHGRPVSEVVRSLGICENIIYRLKSRIETHSTFYAVQVLSRVLRVSRSAYYSYQQHKQTVTKEKKKAVEQNIISIFQEHRRRYGVRRVAAELNANEVKADMYKMCKILKEHGLKAIQPP